MTEICGNCGGECECAGTAIFQEDPSAERVPICPECLAICVRDKAIHGLRRKPTEEGK